MKVISFMGGGSRGLVTLAILRQIEKRSGKKIKDLFELMLGTSTGSIIAAGLALGIPAEKLIELYIENVGMIFKTDIWFKLRSTFNLGGPKYSRWGLDEMLKKHYAADKIMLSEISGPMYGSHIILTSYDTLAQRIVLFDSADDKINQVPLITAIGASASAPTYLPAVEDNFNGQARSMVDGGIYAGSPAMVGFGEILKAKESDNTLISVGTGLYTSEGYNTVGWGMIDWLMHKGNTPILDCTFRSQQEKDHYIIRKIMGEDFIELDHSIPSRIPMDAKDQPTLLGMANMELPVSEIDSVLHAIGA